jgi:hypothetical protein
MLDIISILISGLFDAGGKFSMMIQRKTQISLTATDIYTHHAIAFVNGSVHERCVLKRERN